MSCFDWLLWSGEGLVLPDCDCSPIKTEAGGRSLIKLLEKISATEKREDVWAAERCWHLYVSTTCPRQKVLGSNPGRLVPFCVDFACSLCSFCRHVCSSCLTVQRTSCYRGWRTDFTLILCDIVMRSIKLVNSAEAKQRVPNQTHTVSLVHPSLRPDLLPTGSAEVMSCLF